jgi:hypothetical protein
MSYRDFVVNALEAVRSNLDMRTGSPLRIWLVDPLILFASYLEDEIEATKTQPVETTAANFIVDKDDGDPAKVTFRALYYNPVAVEFEVGAASIIDDDGNTFTNTSAISRTADDMRLYVDGIYYYVDFEAEGDTVYNTDASYSWDNGDEELAMVVVQSVTSSGSPADTDAVLTQRILDTSTLRSQVTRPGTVALLADEYLSKLREATCVGFLDDEMQRDIKEGYHVGGYMDVYVKGDQPADATLTQTVGESLTRVFTDYISFAFLDGADTTWDIPFANLQTASVESYARASTPFTEGNDYTVDMTAGEFTHMSSGNIYLETKALVTFNGATIVINGNLTSDVFEHYVVVLDDGAGTESQPYRVKSTQYAVPNTEIELERSAAADAAAAGVVWVNATIYEPVVVNFTYIPVGFELADFVNPITALIEFSILDPLTGDDTGNTVPLLGGWGAGSFGGGPFGMGNSYGWTFTIDDETLRFSNKETGFFQLPASYVSDNIKAVYKYDPDVSTMQTFLEDQRTMVADVLVKCFIPVNTTLDIDVESTTDITGMDAFIWAMTGTVNMSTIIAELHEKGATQVDIDDLMENGTFEAWLADGTFVNYQPDGAGQLDLGNRLMRLHPTSITVESE